jgi:hypothetical protein
MSAQPTRPPAQERPVVPQFWIYFVVLLSFTAFTLALIYILLDSGAR